MRAPRTLALAGVACVGAILPASAQPGPTPSAPPCDAKPWPAFAALAGRWAIEMDYRLAPGKVVHTQATSVIALAPTPCVITEYLSTTLDGAPVRMMFATSFANAEAPERIYYDTGHARFLVFSGSQMAGTYMFTHEQTPNSVRLINRLAIRELAKDSFVTEMQLSRDGGATWDQVQLLRYARVR